MSKSYDEKREAFDRLCEPRLERAVKSIELLANLARKSDYACTDAKLQRMLDSLDGAVDVVAQAFGAAPVGSAPAAPEGDVLRAASSGGGDTREVVAAPILADQRAEVRWAHDALRRGDRELAEARLGLVIKAWIEESRA